MKRKNLYCSLALLALTGCSTELDRCIDANIDQITAEYQITEKLYERAKVAEIGVSVIHITDPSVADSIVWAKNLKHSRTDETIPKATSGFRAWSQTSTSQKSQRAVTISRAVS